MAEENLEQKVNGTHEEKKEEKKPVSTLESVISEFTDAVKAGLNLGIGVAAPAAGYALTGNIGVPVMSGAFVAASSGNVTSKRVKNESLIGSLVGSIMHYFSLPLIYMSFAAKAAYLTLTPLVTNTVYPPIDHLIKNKTTKGLSEKMKSYWSNVKRTFKTSWPIAYFPSLFLPQAYVVTAMGLAFYVYRKFVVKNKDDSGKNEDKTPYSVAAPNVAKKLIRNTAKGLSETIYAIGSSIGDLYKTSPKTAAPSQPAAQH